MTRAETTRAALAAHMRRYRGRWNGGQPTYELTDKARAALAGAKAVNP